MAVSGIPPAVYVQVIIRCITAKAGYGMGGFGSPCFYYPKNTACNAGNSKVILMRKKKTSNDGVARSFTDHLQIGSTEVS